jgi:hypothetical protein
MTRQVAPRLALLLVAVCAGAAGCAFDSALTVKFRQGAVTATESSTEVQETQRVHGVTTKNGQTVRIDCSLTGFYTIKEATGTAFLTQRYIAHLRTLPLAKGTPFDIDCADPLVVELPDDATRVRADATTSRRQWPLPVESRVRSLPIGDGKRLRADPNTLLAVVPRPRALPSGDYRTELIFALKHAHPIQIKMLFAASVSCGSARYLEPILPPVATMAQVPDFKVQPSVAATKILIPRIAAGIESQAEGSRTLACGH